VTRSSLCSVFKDCGTKGAHNTLFPKTSFQIPKNYGVAFVKDSAINVYVIRRSFWNTYPTAVMFSSVIVDFGQQLLSSISTSYLVSQNREYHLNTFDRLRTTFPSVLCSNTSDSVAHRPSLKQNYMATVCSFLSSMTYE
jgi:hypothetical protein